MNSFPFSLFAALSLVLLWNQSFGRCELPDTIIENGHDPRISTGDQQLSQNGEEEGKSNSGSASASGSGSASEDEPEDLYFYFFDNESVVIEYEALTDSDAKDEPDFLYHPLPGQIRIVEFYAQ